MKTKALGITLLFIVLVSCSPVVTAVSIKAAIPMPTVHSDNFAFILNDSPCEVNVLDTNKGTFIHTPVDETTPITISLRLTDDELESVYQRALSINFFGLPSKIVAPDNVKQWMSTPSGTYKLSITNGAITNSVTWTSDIITQPLFTEAAQFMELIELIRKIIKSHPEIQKLPKPKAACA